MNIKTLKVNRYRGRNIYVRNFGTTFEFLFIFSGEMHTRHIQVTKPLMQRLLRRPYTDKQLADTTQVVMELAERVVDKLLENAREDRQKSSHANTSNKSRTSKG